MFDKKLKVLSNKYYKKKFKSILIFHNRKKAHMLLIQLIMALFKSPSQSQKAGLFLL